VFGDVHPSDGVLVLLRYYRQARAWRKPPVFGAEVLDGSILRHYDIPRRTVHRYGLTLGLVPLASLSAQRCYDPLGDQSRELISDVARFAGPGTTVGLTGSRLLGLAAEHSDLDLVLYGADTAGSSRRLLRELLVPGTPLAEVSSTIRRITALTGGRIPRLDDRNIFKGAIHWQGRVRKIDLHYAADPRPVAHVADFDGGRLAAADVTAEFIVYDPGGRRFFPGYLVCRRTNRDLMRVWIRDHVLAFLLDGDRFTVRGNEVWHGDRPEFVGIEVVDLWLG
jgi:hypothetical protein